MKKALAILIFLVLCTGAGCATGKKVGITVGGAFGTAGKATGEAAVTAAKATEKAAKWSVRKTGQAFTGNQCEDEPPPKK